MEKSEKGFSQDWLAHSFFDSLKKDYSEFEGWFKKSEKDESKTGFYWLGEDKKDIYAFLGLKTEDEEIILDGVIVKSKSKRIKITTIKAVPQIKGFSEMVIFYSIFRALTNNIKEIYFSIIPDSDEKVKLMEIAKSFGFIEIGTAKNGKNGEVRNNPEVYLLKEISFDQSKSWKENYPKISLDTKRKYSFLPIFAGFHDTYLQEAKLMNNIHDGLPEKISIKKHYLHSDKRILNLNEGDIVFIYRMAEAGKTARYYSAITGVAMIDRHFIKYKDYNNIEDAKIISGKDHAFSSVKEFEKWVNEKKYITRFLFLTPFGAGNNINRDKLLQNGILNEDKQPQETLVTAEVFLEIIKEVGEHVPNIIAD